MLYHGFGCVGLKDIKSFLAQYFAQKAIDKADNDTMDRWLSNENKSYLQ
ncbi:MAG: hypothetical protein JXQ76_01585 [Campylobacterales bacterium]|nr:hypothetical protein [Campylobacterales bacterium]